MQRKVHAFRATFAPKTNRKLSRFISHFVDVNSTNQIKVVTQKPVEITPVKQIDPNVGSSVSNSSVNSLPTTQVPARSKPAKKERINPLFVGTVEEDIPVDDPYFNHNGNLTSFLAFYAAFHDNLTASHSKRVVVYLPMKETGLGNSLLALSASYIYAILTKRAFQLNYRQFTKHFRFDFKEVNSTYTCTCGHCASFL